MSPEKPAKAMDMILGDQQAIPILESLRHIGKAQFMNSRHNQHRQVNPAPAPRPKTTV